MSRNDDAAADLRGLNYGPGGLIPVVIQDAASGQVLTLAWANEEAVRRTAETGQTWLWSRSRSELWHKGATSGNTQRVQAILADCDADSLVYQVVPAGPACHTGAESCFRPTEARTAAPPLGELLAHLRRVAEDRKATRPEGSYTTYLFEKGLDKICKKIGEEATEVVIALKNGEPGAIADETADLLYHLVVGLTASGTDLADVAAALEKRLGKHGRVPTGIQRPAD